MTEQQVRAALHALGIEVPERVKELSRWNPELRLAFLLGLLWRRVGQTRDAEIARAGQQDGEYMAGPNEPRRGPGRPGLLRDPLRSQPTDRAHLRRG
ncbi:hypothetical protein [Kitasatospora sp. NPDC001132]